MDCEQLEPRYDAVNIPIEQQGGDTCYLYQHISFKNEDGALKWMEHHWKFLKNYPRENIAQDILWECVKYNMERMVSKLFELQLVDSENVEKCRKDWKKMSNIRLSIY